MTRAFLSLILPLLAFAVPLNAAPPDEIVTSGATFETKMALRDLWVEHVFWIRSYVIAGASDDATQRAAAETEVVNNARALASTIAPFYGESASAQLFDLLAGHWGAVKAYDKATFEASKSAKDNSVTLLTENARAIAQFLGNANPHLPEDAVFGLLAAHGAHHVTQIDQIKARQFEKEAETWAAMRKHMLVIADSIAEALAKQFPEKFARS